MSFNKDFIWGSATSSYQIEGAPFEDGKGLSVWDTFCEVPGVIKSNHNGNIACEHYHRYKEDVALMKELGLQAYRFSITWPRVMPDGIGRINEKGLDFYDRLVDELLEKGITPYVTLFHWDYPYELYKKGGWLNNDSPEWFAEYTKVVVDRLSDRVQYWFTQNEPQCYINLGHCDGTHAPGLKLGVRDVLQCTHNSLLAHGKSVATIKEFSKLKSFVGAAPVGICYIPKTETPGDIEAARKATFAVNDTRIWNSAWFMDPMFLGEYPEDGLKLFEKYLPKIGANDMKIINQDLDFFGCNIYSSPYVNLGPDGEPEFSFQKVGADQTANKWELTPRGLYWGPKFFYERYKKPIMITENGLSNVDWVSLDGKVHDPQRIDLMHRYINEFNRAIKDGVDGRGYFAWSLMDNFEWAEGYNERFGLIHVDFETQKRTIKDSGYWFKQVIETQGKILE